MALQFAMQEIILHHHRNLKFGGVHILIIFIYNFDYYLCTLYFQYIYIIYKTCKTFEAITICLVFLGTNSTLRVYAL